MKNIALFLSIILFIACQDQTASYEKSVEGYSAQPTSYDQMETVEDADFKASDFEQSSRQSERKVIKTAEIRFQVKALKESTKKIETLTNQYKGMVTAMNQTNSNYSIDNSLTVKVPYQQLDQFIASIEKESIHTNYTRINAQDVTEEYVDISGRLTTKKEVRDRYIDILRNKAKTVKDILEAEEKIRVIQEEIESIEGRLKYLNNQTSMSTVYIQMYQEVEYVKSPDVYRKSFLTKLQEGFSNGWELIQEIIIGLISIWPIILILFLLIYLRKKLWKSIRG